MEMTYKRIIPRDFFNEAKLLKCMGLLSLKIEDRETPEGIKIEIESNNEPFEIVLLEEGSLTIKNYLVKVNGKRVTMKTTYNSKSPFPLMCGIGYDEWPVFTDEGEFDEEFIEKFQQ